MESFINVTFNALNNKKENDLRIFFKIKLKTFKMYFKFVLHILENAK